MRIIQTFVFSLMFCAFGIAVVHATPPSDITLAYDQAKQKLSIEVAHQTDNVSKHYISKIEISKNDEASVTKYFFFQTDPTGVKIDVDMNAQTGDTIRVKATCIQGGQKEQTLIVPEPEESTSASPAPSAGAGSGETHRPDGASAGAYESPGSDNPEASMPLTGNGGDNNAILPAVVSGGPGVTGALSGKATEAVGGKTITAVAPTTGGAGSGQSGSTTSAVPAAGDQMGASEGKTLPAVPGAQY